LLTALVFLLFPKFRSGMISSLTYTKPLIILKRNFMSKYSCQKLSGIVISCLLLSYPCSWFHNRMVGLRWTLLHDAALVPLACGRIQSLRTGSFLFYDFLFPSTIFWENPEVYLLLSFVQQLACSRSSHSIPITHTPRSFSWFIAPRSEPFKAYW
jgi:hypothetical protein